MASITNHLKNIWQIISDPTMEQKEKMGDGRSFYIVLTFILGTVSILVIYSSPFLKKPFQLAAFIAIILLHIVLHWLSFLCVDSTRLTIAYLLTQGILSLLAVLISGAPELVLAIFAAMIGETIGLFGTTRLSWFSVVALLILAPLSYILIGGVETLQDWSSPTISTMIILIVFMVLFRKQLESNEQAQTLASDLRDANQQLSSYAIRNEALTLQAERERMARELHDTLAQGVAGLILQLEALKAYQKQEEYEKADNVLRQALDRARSTLSESRAAIEDLRNEDTDFKRTVEKVIAEFHTTEKTKCELDIQLENGKKLPQNIQHHARRVLHEALNNIQKHAQAEVARVSIVQSEKTLMLRIKDDGIGFDPEEIREYGHFGLQGFQERAQLLNSQYKLISSPNEGTTVEFLFSLDQGEGA